MRLLLLPDSLSLLLVSLLLSVPTTSHVHGTSLHDESIDRPQHLSGNGTDLELARRAENDAFAKRHAAIESRLATEAPVGMRKMSGDPDEKFWPEYWIFADEIHRGTNILGGRNDGSGWSLEQHESPIQDRRSRAALPYNNSTMGFLPPLLLHRNPNLNLYSPRSLPLDLLMKRAYQCPGGYHSCASVNQPDTCCATDETCAEIPDTGIGTVGCCPSGADCSGSVSSCDTSQGYTPCPNSANDNGCCLPGLSCDDIGCSGDTPVIPQAISITTATLVNTIIVPPQINTIYLTTTTPTSTTTLPPALSTTQITLLTTITSANAPIRASSDETETVTVLTATPAPSASICPQNYYRCSAYYNGGCCQVGRDCASTNCPSTASVITAQNGDATVIVGVGSGVVTVAGGTAVPTTAATTVTAQATVETVTAAGGVGTGTTTTLAPVSATSVIPVAEGGLRCPNAFFACAAEQGGGCCPDGYVCGDACSASVGGVPTRVVKVVPEQVAGGVMVGFGVGEGGWCGGVGLVVVLVLGVLGGVVVLL